MRGKIRMKYVSKVRTFWITSNSVQVKRRGKMTYSWHVKVDQVGSFDIVESDPLFSDGASKLVRYGRVPGRRLVFMDEAVYNVWAEVFKKNLADHQVDATIVKVPGGEAAKSMDVALKLVREMRVFGLDRRHDPLIVVGGGAVLDVSGFSASMYRRGVPYIRVPTTLLAYVDASVGIKTGVNYGIEKNLLGSFYPPTSVVLSRAFFDTLPTREFSSGQGEILKLAVGCDGELFDMLIDYSARTFQNFALEDKLGGRILNRAVTTMVEELQPNLFEQNLYRSVDMGHTFSQPLEMTAGLRHGEAVSMDVQLSAVISAERGLLKHRDLNQIITTAAGLGLPTRLPEIEPELLWRSQLERVEHRGGAQHTPLPTGIGRCTFVDDLCQEELYDAINYLRQN